MLEYVWKPNRLDIPYGSINTEKDPKLAIKINNLGVENTLEVARLNDLRIYIPSSIAGRDSTPQH